MNAPASTGAPAMLDGDLARCFGRLIGERFGLRVDASRAGRLGAALSPLLASEPARSPLALYQSLARGARPEVLADLAAGLTVGETYFFRGGAQIAALREVVLPELIARRAGERRLRLWSAGCSTGEEPYTLAMLLRAQLPALDAWTIDLLGTDVNPAALAEAREACYGEWSFRETPPEVRRRYFAPELARWRLLPAVRQMVRVARLNLAADAFAPLVGAAACDLILCRNVTIYFEPAATQALYGRLAAALAPGGWLVLGAADPAPGRHPGLEPVDLPGAVLWRRPFGQAPKTEFPPGGVRRLLPGQRGAPAAARPHLAAKGAESRPVGGPERAVPPRAGAVPRRGTDPSPTSPPDSVRLVLAEHMGGKSQPLPPSGQGGFERRLFHDGLRRLDAGDPDGAIDLLRQATYLWPDDALAQFALARAYAQRGEASRSRSLLMHARRLLAPLADDAALPADAAVTAGRVRGAVDALLRHLAPQGGEGSNGG